MGLGAKLRLEAERGYHVMLPMPDTPIRRFIQLVDDKFVLVPHEDGLRLTSGIEYAKLDTVVVRILGTPPGNSSSHTIEVDKGLDDGLAEGMAVVTGAGLVGRLEVVDRSRSIVRLATHPAFRVGVRLVGSQDEGLARGGGTSGHLVIDAGIRPDVQVAIGEVVVTSGGRSRFPADIPVGRVIDPDAGADLDREIIVEPAASLEHLSFVNVVLDQRQADAGPLERG